MPNRGRAYRVNVDDRESFKRNEWKRWDGLLSNLHPLQRDHQTPIISLGVRDGNVDQLDTIEGGLRVVAANARMQTAEVHHRRSDEHAEWLEVDEQRWAANDRSLVDERAERGGIHVAGEDLERADGRYAVVDAPPAPESE